MDVRVTVVIPASTHEPMSGGTITRLCARILPA